MTFSKYVSRTVNTPFQDRGRGGAVIDRVVLHHMASTGFEGVLSMWTNATRQGSANYAVSNEGLVVGAVPEENRSWSLSNYAYDARSITFEVENESVGGAWPVSAAAHEATARIVADICTRYRIPCDRAHVVTHREVAAMGFSYATACPGGLDADRIVARANQIRSGANVAAASAEAILDELRRTTMYLAYDTNGGGHLFTEQGCVSLTGGNGGTAELFFRLINSDQSKNPPTAVGTNGAPERFAPAQIEAMRAALRSAS